MGPATNERLKCHTVSVFVCGRNMLSWVRRKYIRRWSTLSCNVLSLRLKLNSEKKKPASRIYGY